MKDDGLPPAKFASDISRTLATAFSPYAETMRRLGEALKAWAPGLTSLRDGASAKAVAVRAFEQRRTDALNDQCIKNRCLAGDYEGLAAVFLQKRRLKRKAGEDARHFCQRYLMATNPAWNGNLLPREAFEKAGRRSRLTIEKIANIEQLRATGVSILSACDIAENCDTEASNRTYRQYLRYLKKRQETLA